MDKKTKLLSKKVARIRGWIQAIATLLTNIHIPNLLKGKIYQGKIKTVCVPGLNCYSCPAATGAPDAPRRTTCKASPPIFPATASYPSRSLRNTPIVSAPYALVKSPQRRYNGHVRKHNISDKERTHEAQ